MKDILLNTASCTFTRRAFPSSQLHVHLPEEHYPHHNIRDFYLKGILITKFRDIYMKDILLVTNSGMFTRRAFSSSQLQVYVPEGNSPCHTFRDVYLKGILLVTTSGMFTWKTFSSSQLQEYSPEEHSPHHNLRDVYLKGILLITTSEIFT
jgi:hypothetical protein